MQLLQIITQQVKTEILREALHWINESVTDSVNHLKTNLIASAKSYVGYEISVWDEDRAPLFRILQKLDPVNYQKYSITEKDEDLDVFYVPLRNNISYVISLTPIRTFLYVSTYSWDDKVRYTSADVIHVFIFGVCSTQLYELFKKKLNPTDSLPDIILEHTRSLYKHYSCTVNKEQTDCTIMDMGYKKTKDLSQIMTADENIDRITAYLGNWFKANDYITSKGLTFKLGILLYGPPGTGKTTLAQALAAYYGMYLFTLAPNDFCQAFINKLQRLNLASPHILLIEDIDYIFGKRQNELTPEQKERSNLLLQFLDGTKSVKNIITIATTNDIDALDPAIIRAGRFDLKVHMDNIGREAAERLVEELNFTTVPFSLEGETFPVNPATLQGKLLEHVFNNLNQLKEIEEDGGTDYEDDMDSLDEWE